MDQDGMEVGFGPGHTVPDGDPAPPPKKGTAPQFSTHVYCGNTYVCIRMPRGQEVGLSLGDIVLDADPSAPPLKGYSPQFSANDSCWPNGWMD